MANEHNFAELLKEVCMEEEVVNGLDLSKFKTVTLGDYVMEAPSYYTTYYGQDVATTGQARGFYRHINDGHFCVSGKGGRQLIAKSDYEVDLI